MTQVGGIAKEQLQSIIERIERLEEEKANIAADIREVYAESKASGFDARTLRQVIRLRKMDSDDRQEQEYMLELYLAALNMVKASAAEKVEEPALA